MPFSQHQGECTLITWPPLPGRALHIIIFLELFLSCWYEGLVWCRALHDNRVRMTLEFAWHKPDLRVCCVVPRRRRLYNCCLACFRYEAQEGRKGPWRRKDGEKEERGKNVRRWEEERRREQGGNNVRRREKERTLERKKKGGGRRKEGRSSEGRKNSRKKRKEQVRKKEQWSRKSGRREEQRRREEHRRREGRRKKKGETGRKEGRSDEGGMKKEEWKRLEQWRRKGWKQGANRKKERIVKDEDKEDKKERE